MIFTVRVGAGKYIMSMQYLTVQVCVCMRACVAGALSNKRGKSSPSRLVHHKPSHIHSWKPSPDGIGSRDTVEPTKTHRQMCEPLGSSQVPLTQGHTQTGSFRRGLCQFASLQHFRPDPLLTRRLPPPAVNSHIPAPKAC